MSEIAERVLTSPLRDVRIGFERMSEFHEVASSCVPSTENPFVRRRGVAAAAITFASVRGEDGDGWLEPSEIPATMALARRYLALMEIYRALPSDLRQEPGYPDWLLQAALASPLEPGPGFGLDAFIEAARFCKDLNRADGGDPLGEACHRPA